MRLAKYLAGAGLASRRAAEEIIRAGRVSVAGQTVRDPAYGVSDGDQVTVDGRAIRPQTERVVYALNKPPGVVSTARDPQRRPTVVSLLSHESARLYPVGRLDIDTTGLILLTNDGQLANLLTHPRYGVEKTYRARVGNPPVSKNAIEALRRGVVLDDGPTAPALVRRTAPDLLEITIREGRKRQVRRMCEQVGHPVVSLQRVAIGRLKLGGLKPGAYRRLTDAEVASISAGTSARRGAGSSS